MSGVKVRDSKFDDIRPYRDDEIPAAMQRIADNPLFPVVSSFAYPDMDVDEVREMLKGFRTVEEFQREAMYRLNEEIIRSTTAGFTVGGVENISHDRPHLFVSNHRDIVLDASFLQNVLLDAGLDTTEITFGANLMTTQLVVDAGKSNRMFRVERGAATPKEFYLASLHLSEYIRDTLLKFGNSVWIAQRNGRTKDGNDRTDQGIIKMFALSRCDDKVESLAELGIIPVAVSYEWEPCDIQKVLELYESAKMGSYVKKPGEDLSSIISGITANKGRVHFQICEPLTRAELGSLDNLTSSVYNREVAALIDRRIHSAFRLWPNNWIAHDLRYGRSSHQDRYTPEQKAAFLEHIRLLDKYSGSEPETLRDMMLAIYSNPVDNFLRVGQH